MEVVTKVGWEEGALKACELGEKQMGSLDKPEGPREIEGLTEG
jgi:hypothetical protein